MGLFKGLKGLAEVTKTARQLQDQQQVQSGYEPGMRGMMSQMGDMVGTLNEQIKDIAEQSGDQERLLSEGLPGKAVIVAMGTPARGALKFNLYLDLEVHVNGLAPYQIANQYIVPASAPLGEGVVLPVRVDPNDQTKIAIDWANVAAGPTPGEVRPAGVAAASSDDATPIAGAGDPVAALERLAKLRDAGALTEAEFTQAKAAILGT